MNDNDIPLANSKVHYRGLIEEERYAVSTTKVLAGGQTQWHRHTDVSDRWIVVAGVLTVEFKSGNEIRRVEVRDYYAVDAGVSHHVKNETDEDVVYVLVQSGGKRDIVLESSDDAA